MLELAIRCRLAELIGNALRAGGVRPHTRPWAWMDRSFGPIFRRNVAGYTARVDPFSREPSPFLRGVFSSLGEPYGGPPLMAWFLVFFVAAFCLLALPLELWRALGARRQRAAAMAMLPPPGPTSDAYRNSPAGSGGVAAQIARADQVVLADFHVEKRGRIALCGCAVGTVRAGEPEVAWVIGYRGVAPPGALDATALAKRLTASPSVVHWVWDIDDAYELEERDARPW
jgi:hypothetical protein